MVTQTIDTNTDHNRNRTTNLDMALGSKSDLDAIMVSVAAYITQISMVLVTAQPLDINMVSGGWPDPVHLHGSWW